MKRTRPVLLFILALQLCNTASAQLPMVDITMESVDDGRLEVRLRPDLDFNGVFASLVFTVRWEAGSSASILDFEPTDEMAEQGMFPNLSGEVTTSGPYQYAIFAGFGFASLSSLGQSWVANEEVVLGHLLVENGPAGFSLIEDDWTELNNGDYYISLNGADRTGSIYTTTTIARESPALGASCWVFPNPSRGGAWLYLPKRAHGSKVIEVMDASGRVLVQWSTIDGTGSRGIALDSQAPSSGQYLVRCTDASGVYLAKWMIE